MVQFKSSEEAAASISSGIEAAADGVSNPAVMAMDELSSYQGNGRAHEKVVEEGQIAGSAAEVLNEFVSLIQSTAAEFVGMDDYLASQIAKNSQGGSLPSTSAAPSGGFPYDPDFVPDPTLFKE